MASNSGHWDPSPLLCQQVRHYDTSRLQLSQKISGFRFFVADAEDSAPVQQELEDDESDQVPDDVDDDRTHADEDAILREQVLVRAPPDGATARNQRNAGTE